MLFPYPREPRLGNKDFKTSLRSFSALISHFLSGQSVVPVYSTMPWSLAAMTEFLNVLSEEQRPRKREICFIIFYELSALFVLWLTA